MSSGGALITPALKIIKGMLKTIITTLPIAKFLLFKRFIEPEIDANDVNTGEPRKKVTRIKYILSVSIPNIRQAIGITIIKGS